MPLSEGSPCAHHPVRAPLCPTSLPAGWLCADRGDEARCPQACVRGSPGEAAAAGAQRGEGAPCPLCRPLSVGLDVSRELRASKSEPERERWRAAGRGGGKGGREEGKRGGREGGEEDPESARQLEFLQRLAGLQCTAAASRGGSRQPGSSGGGRASGGPAPCPLQTLRAARPGGRGRAREARLGPRPRSPPPQRQRPPPPAPQPRASPGSSRRLPRPPSPGPSALAGRSPGRGGGSSGAAGSGLPGGGRRCPGRHAEAPRALPGGSPAHSPRPGSGPTGRAWAARSDAAVPAWHQGHSARGGWGRRGAAPRRHRSPREPRLLLRLRGRVEERGAWNRSTFSDLFVGHSAHLGRCKRSCQAPQALISPSVFLASSGFPVPRWSICVRGWGWRRQPHARTRTRSEEGERQRHRHHLQCQCGAPAEGGESGASR